MKLKDVEIVVELSHPDLDFACRQAYEKAKDIVDESYYSSDTEESFYNVEEIKFDGLRFTAETSDSYGSYNYRFTASLAYSG